MLSIMQSLLLRASNSAISIFGFFGACFLFQLSNPRVDRLGLPLNVTVLEDLGGKVRFEPPLLLGLVDVAHFTDQVKVNVERRPVRTTDIRVVRGTHVAGRGCATACITATSLARTRAIAFQLSHSGLVGQQEGQELGHCRVVKLGQFGNGQARVELEVRTQFPEGRVDPHFRQEHLYLLAVEHPLVKRRCRDELGRKKELLVRIGRLDPGRVLFLHRLPDRIAEYLVRGGTDLRQHGEQSEHPIVLLLELIEGGQLAELSRFESPLQVRADFAKSVEGIPIPSKHEEGNAGVICEGNPGTDHRVQRLDHGGLRVLFGNYVLLVDDNGRQRLETRSVIAQQTLETGQGDGGEDSKVSVDRGDVLTPRRRGESHLDKSVQVPEHDFDIPRVGVLKEL